MAAMVNAPAPRATPQSRSKLIQMPQEYELFRLLMAPMPKA